MRRTFGLIVGIATLLSCGCTDTQLRITTVNQGATMAEMQYQMILRNLATFAENPSAIPWHMSITQGTAQVADAGTGHVTPVPSFAPVRTNRFFQLGAGVSGSRTIVQQWSTNPIVHTDALRLLQLAYQRAYGSERMPDAELISDLVHDIKKQVLSTEDLRTETMLFYQSQFSKANRSYDGIRHAASTTVGDQEVAVPMDGVPDPLEDRKSPLAREVAREVNDIIDDLRQIKPGWFGVGGKRDVPKNARYVAHEGKIYTWVCPDHLSDLSKFTLALLDIATAVQEPETLSLQGGGLNFSPGFTAPP